LGIELFDYPNYPICRLPDCLQDFLLRRILPLVVSNERVRDPAVRLDEKDRGPRDVPGVQADAVPDAVGAEHVAPFVDQDIEGQAGFLDVAAHRLAILRQDAGDLDPAGFVSGDVGGELTEPVAAVGSPGAAVEHQQQPASREEVRERADPPLLINQ
jgi:hypothetical protein